MQNFILFILLPLLTQHASAAVANSDSAIKATVLHQILAGGWPSDIDIGLQMSEAQIEPLRVAFGPDGNLMTIAAYLRKHPHPDAAKAACFWIEIKNRTPDSCIVWTGDYPNKVMTKWGLMSRYTTDWEYVLAKRKGNWLIVSSKITGES
jgi:hypothetical protein